MCGDYYSSGCGRGPDGGGITVVAKEDYDNILKDAEKTVNDVCNKADLRKKWIEGLPIENKDINKNIDKDMCGNFCDLELKNAMKQKSCSSLNDPNVRPGSNYEWIATCGGGGRWEEVSPDKEYWENYKKQYDKDPKSTANVIEKDDFNKLIKEAEETVNNINFKSDNAVDEEHKRYEEYCNLSQKRSMKTVDDLKTCENEGCKFCEFGPELCERFEEFDLMVGPQKCKHWQNKYSGEKYDKTPTTISIEDAKKAEKEANKELENIEQAKGIEKQTIEHLQKGSANVIRRTYEKLAKGVGWDEPYETYMDRVSGKKTDLTKEQEDKLHKDELNSDLFKSIVAKFIGVADMHPNTFIDGYLMSGDEQIKAEPGQYCAYANKIYKLVPNPLMQNPTLTHWEWKVDTPNIYLRTITVDDIVDAWMLEQCKYCNREKHCSDCRVHKVWVKDTEEGEDVFDVKDKGEEALRTIENKLYKEVGDAARKSTLDTLYKLGKENLEKDASYKYMTDEEMLEQLKKNAVDNIMSKLSGQVVDLVSDAMKTVELDFQRSKLVRDTYEATRQTGQTLKDDCEKSLKSCIHPSSTLKSDFMNQWVNEMMEKQAKQINMSVINEGLYLKNKFVEFLQSLNFKSNIYDVYSTVERKINELKEEIEFSEGFLKDMKNII